MWNKLVLSFKNAGSAQKFKYFLNGMEEGVCECNSFKCILCMLQRLEDHMCVHRMFPFIPIVSLYITIQFVDSFS